MHKEKINLKLLTFKTLVIINCLTSFQSEAVPLYSSSSIKVLEPITFLEEKKLNFGTIVTPGTEELVEISLSGTVGTGTTAQYLDSSGVSEASVKISGSSNNNINIVAEYLDNEPNIEVLSMKAAYRNTSGDLIKGLSNLNSYSSGESLKFGAGIKISSNTSEGNYYPVLRLSVNYE